MLVRNSRRPVPHSGTTLVEMAVICSLLFLVLFGLILGSIVVFRYHQVAQLAREGSRWASVHGAQWAYEKNGNVLTTPQDVYDKGILPRAAAIETGKLSYTVTWDDSQKRYHTAIVNDQVVPVNNNVIVKVSYQWDGFLFGPVTLSSTSVSIMHY